MEVGRYLRKLHRPNEERRSSQLLVLAVDANVQWWHLYFRHQQQQSELPETDFVCEVLGWKKSSCTAAMLNLYSRRLPSAALFAPAVRPGV